MSSDTGIPVRERHVSPNSIAEIINADLREERYRRVATRFPPEPNGCLRAHRNAE